MTIADEYLDISTPENVVFGYQVAGIGSRFLAALVDTILIAILQLIVYLVIQSLLDLTRFVGSFASSTMVAILFLVAFAFFWGYYIFFETLWNGQSPGKRWVKLRTIRSDGTPIGLSEVIIRNLVRIIDFLPAYYGVGVIAMFIDNQSRRLGDMAAGTLVVYDTGQVTLDSLTSSTLPILHHSPTTFSGEPLPLRRLHARDIALVESFLQRRYELENRSVLAIKLARMLLQKMELPARDLTEPEAMALFRAVVNHDLAASSTIEPPQLNV